ncbi:MAG: diacylglycerol kinase family lipid kinase, partial [Candidatus Dormibacteraeota bacterium]|nr:diacylglycerol kinase family lipid kinase [Candidatus Dormibacteraeota bacterium]
GRTGRRWSEIATLMLDAGLDFETHFTTVPGDATRAVRAGLRAGRSRVVAVGGDGTLNEVVNGFFDERGSPLAPDAVLALLPSGTGGDFCKAAGIPGDPRGAIAILTAGATRRIDAGRIDFEDGERRHFINIADCGLGGAVVSRVNRSRFKSGGARGSAVFLWQSLATVWTFAGGDVAVRVDTHRFEGAVQSVVVANGRYFGGGMHIAPHALLDDGVFDVIIVEARSRSRTLRGLPSVYRGRHLGEPGVTALRGAEVRIETRGTPLLFDVEGEQIGTTPATLTCLKGAIRICAPAANGAA